MTAQSLPASIEVAPGIHIPADQLEQFQFEVERNPNVARAVADMHIVLTEVAPQIFVPRKDVAAWIARMESEPEFCMAMDCLMDRLNTDVLSDVTITLSLTPMAELVLGLPPRRHSVHSFALGFGNRH